MAQVCTMEWKEDEKLFSSYNMEHFLTNARISAWIYFFIAKTQSKIQHSLD